MSTNPTLTLALVGSGTQWSLAGVGVEQCSSWAS